MMQLPTEIWFDAWRRCSRWRTSLASTPRASSSDSSRPSARRRAGPGRAGAGAGGRRTGRSGRPGPAAPRAGAGRRRPRPPGRAVGQGLGRPDLGPPPLVPAPEHLPGEPAEVLQQDQPEHRRQGPQLADRQRGDPLEGADEPGQPRLVDLAVGVRDEREGQGVNPGVAPQRGGGELRQLLRRNPGAGRGGPRGGLPGGCGSCRRTTRRRARAPRDRRRAVGDPVRESAPGTPRSRRTAPGAGYRPAGRRQGADGGQADRVRFQVLKAVQLRADRARPLWRDQQGRGEPVGGRDGAAGSTRVLLIAADTLPAS